jgi:hypothetical protein
LTQSCPRWGQARHCITKRYPTDGRQLATSIDGDLYYHLLDPTGTSLTLADEQGNEAGYVLYDAFGGVLTSTLSADLAAALSSQGAIGDADTRLVHLGGGRWYDPALGRPLQPNPVGGPPIVPQALNRYSATPLGQPGVAEAAVNGGGCLDNTLCNELVTGISGLTAGEAANTPLFNWVHLNLHRLRNGRILSAGPPPLVRRSPKIDFEIFSPEPGVLRTRAVVRGFENIVQFRQVLRTTSTRFDKITGELGQSGLKNTLPFGVDFGFQLYQDWNNPHLPWDRKIRRGFVAGGVGLIAGRIVALVIAPEATVPFLISSAIFGILVEGPFVTLVNENAPFLRELPRNLKPLE